jgi:drug/metabolite transporter (DMT)-like permease
MYASEDEVTSERRELAPSGDPGLAPSGDPRWQYSPRRQPLPRSAMRHVALLSVPILWGTFTPSMKLLLDRRHAPPVILTNLLSHAAGTVALSVLWLCEAASRRRCLPDEVALEAPTGKRMALASCELGVYLFFGQLTQLLGLSGTSATTNAILVQSSVVLVPVIEEARSTLPAAGRLHRLLPSLLALLGIVTITAAPTLLAAAAAAAPPPPPPPPAAVADDDAAEGQSAFGVACSLASACFYSLHTLRLSEYGDVDATVQATGQVAANAVQTWIEPHHPFSAIWCSPSLSPIVGWQALDVLTVTGSALIGGGGGSAVRWWRHAAHTDPAALQRLGAAAMWNGIFIVAATTWGMSYGA